MGVRLVNARALIPKAFNPRTCATARGSLAHRALQHTRCYPAASTQGNVELFYIETVRLFDCHT